MTEKEEIAYSFSSFMWPWQPGTLMLQRNNRIIVALKKALLKRRPWAIFYRPAYETFKTAICLAWYNCFATGKAL